MDGIQAKRPAMILVGSAGQRRMMVFRAFLAQNIAVGCAFGSFGVAVIPLQQHYGASRAMVTLCLGLCLLVLGLVSPLIGTMIGRLGLRRTMLIGTIVSGMGYAMLAIAPSMVVVLALYALPIGIGLAMFGPFPSSVLASNWSPHNPGPALGIANMPLLVAILPIVSAFMVREFGLSGLYLLLAGLHVLLIPFIFGVSDRPADAADASASGEKTDLPEMLPTARLFGTATFWAMCVGGGYLNAVGVIAISHIVPFAAERGISIEQAALLLSVMGGAGVIGSLIVGMLCSRLGGALTLALIAASQVAGWFVLLSTSAFPVMATTAFFLGIGGAGVFPAINVLSGRLFGLESLPRVLGLFGLVTLPFTFGMPPLAGVLRDVSADYGTVIMGIVICSTAAAALFVTMARLAVWRSQRQVVPAT